jgi:DNA-binding phage protein
MIATRSYRDTLNNDLQTDSEFRRALLSEVLGCMASGDVETGKSVLRKYIDGTIGFEKLAAALGRTPNSLMRMLSQTANPHVSEFFEVVAYLQKIDSTVLTVQGISAIAA